MGKHFYLCLECILCIYPKNGYTLITSLPGRDTSPIAPPRGINATHGSTSSLASNTNVASSTTTIARSEFFIPTQEITQQLQQHQQPQQVHRHHQKQHLHHNNFQSANKLPTNTVFNTLNDFQNHNSSVNFNEIHEQFRQLVMKDIVEYQAQREMKSQPLIQL